MSGVAMLGISVGQFTSTTCARVLSMCYGHGHEQTCVRKYVQRHLLSQSSKSRMTTVKFGRGGEGWPLS